MCVGVNCVSWFKALTWQCRDFVTYPCLSHNYLRLLVIYIVCCLWPIQTSSRVFHPNSTSTRRRNIWGGGQLGRRKWRNKVCFWGWGVPPLNKAHFLQYRTTMEDECSYGGFSGIQNVCHFLFLFWHRSIMLGYFECVTTESFSLLQMP